MAETDGAWWSEVEHLREGIERKRAQATEPTGFDRVAGAKDGRFARRQEQLTATERDRVVIDVEPTEAPQRTGRFDRDDTILLERDPDPADAPPPPEPISPAALLSLDVGWQESVRREPEGEFTELIIPGQGVPGRPTVQIRGRGTEGRVDAQLPDRARRRPSRTVSERLGPRPDRVALWALVLAVVLIITAVATADASTLT
jgi:hypothetical protein